MSDSHASIVSLLRAPRTGAPLRWQDDRYVSDDGTSYIVRDGIIDFIQDDVREDLYQMDIRAARAYDLWVTNPWTMRLVWGLDPSSMSPKGAMVPNFPAGPVLDVPCGTAVFGVEAYQARPDCLFVAVDYSREMLRVARERCEHKGLTNVVFVRADVHALPFAENSFGACLSMAGMHVFPEPQHAARELARCVQPGGPLSISALCADQRWFSDLVLRQSKLLGSTIRNNLTAHEYERMFEREGVRINRRQNFGAYVILGGKKQAQPSSNT